MEGEIKAGDEFSANPQQTTPAFATWYSSEKIGPFKATVESGDTSAEASVKFVGGKAITDFLGTDVTKYKIKRFEVYNTTTGKAIATVYGAAAGAAANVTYDGSKGEFTVKVPAGIFSKALYSLPFLGSKPDFFNSLTASNKLIFTYSPFYLLVIFLNLHLHILEHWHMRIDIVKLYFTILLATPSHRLIYSARHINVNIPTLSQHSK